jgi:hypothetical protein
MFRRPSAARPDDASDAPPKPAAPSADDASDAPDGSGVTDLLWTPPDFSSLPIAGITRRHLAAVVGVLLAAWIVVAFTRQVGEASAATTTADELAAANHTSRSQIGELQRELDTIVRQRYVEQQARGYGLGNAKEVAFSLEPGAPPLAEDAPGSAAVRLGAEPIDIPPLERWLTLLFGPSD